jgi:rubrerythrin
MIERALEKLIVAFNTEVVGYRYYKAASEIVDDEKGKDMFRHLAGDELDHIKMLSGITEALKKDGKWLTYGEALGIGEKSIEEASLPIFPDDKLEDLKKSPDELNAIKMAIEVEGKAIEYYSKMLNDAEDAEEKTVLIKLVDMERAHLKLLRWEQESLKQTGFWCDIMEFNIEKEIG